MQSVMNPMAVNSFTNPLSPLPIPGNYNAGFDFAGPMMNPYMQGNSMLGMNAIPHYDGALDTNPYLQGV